MFQKGQTHFENLAAFSDFVKFYEISKLACYFF